MQNHEPSPFDPSLPEWAWALPKRQRLAVEAGHPEWFDLPEWAFAAEQLGFETYFPGRACKNGHIAPRVLRPVRKCIMCEDKAQPKIDMDEDPEQPKTDKPLDRQALAVAAGYPQWADLADNSFDTNFTVANVYFAGKPCPRGHIAPRYKGGGCVICGNVKDLNFPTGTREDAAIKAGHPEWLQLPSERGSGTYFTGKPCPAGNVAPRSKQESCMCAVCVKALAALMRRHQVKRRTQQHASKAV